VNNESLRISLRNRQSVEAILQDDCVWDVVYHGWAECPRSWDEIDGLGWPEVSVETNISEHNNATVALAKAREWAVDSGFKAGPIKPLFGNTIEIRLRRP
jgi:hypothetical protein